MDGIILLNHTENTHKVEEEERTRFLRSILEQTGVPIQDFWATDEVLSVDQRIKLRDVLSAFSIQVIQDNDGRLSIYVEGEKIAEWKKPTYKLKRDLQQLDRKKQLFLEMSISCWSLFEETENNPTT
jgi:hypothetical protein